MQTRHAAWLALLAASLLSPPLLAWEKHQSLMAGILSGLPEGGVLDKHYPAPCPPDDEKIYERLAAELYLNPKPREALKPTAPEACGSRQQVTAREILAAEFVDEPDHGMDQD